MITKRAVEVIETINKRGGFTFTKDDEVKLKMMSFHMGLFMKTLDVYFV